MTLGFWDAEGGTGIPRDDLPDPAGELDAARAALLAGSIDEAVLRFALALRLAPALAPAILEATDGVSGPAVSVIRWRGRRGAATPIASAAASAASPRTRASPPRRRRQVSLGSRVAVVMPSSVFSARSESHGVRSDAPRRSRRGLAACPGAIKRARWREMARHRGRAVVAHNECTIGAGALT